MPSPALRAPSPGGRGTALPEEPAEERRLFSAAGIAERDWRFAKNVVSVYDRERIVIDETTRHFFSHKIRCSISTSAQDRRATFRTMRVSGEKMHAVMTEKR